MSEIIALYGINDFILDWIDAIDRKIYSTYRNNMVLPSFFHKVQLFKTYKCFVSVSNMYTAG